MNLRSRIGLIGLIGLISLGSGCASVTPNYDAKFGVAVRDAKVAMTISSPLKNSFPLNRRHFMSSCGADA